MRHEVSIAAITSAIALSTQVMLVRRQASPMMMMMGAGVTVDTTAMT